MFERIKDIIKPPETKTVVFNELSEEETYSLLISSTKLHDGSFGIEWIKTQYKSEFHLFMPLSQTYILNNETVRAVLPRDKEYSIYTAINTKSSCFPLRLDYKKYIWDDLNKYLKVNGEIVFTQLILQKQQKSWTDKYKQQYVDYLQGINPYFVTSNSVFRSIQYKVMDYVKSREWSIGFEENPTVHGIEKKFSEDGFSICLRFAVFGDKDSQQRLTKQIELILRDMDYANNWRLSKDTNRSESLNQIILRKFPLMHREQILCVSELMPFFCAKDVLKTKTEAFISEADPKSELPVRLSFKLPSLSHLPLPKDKKLPTTADLQKHEGHINKVLSRINVIKDTERVKVSGVVEAATIRKITFQLPKGLTFSNFNEAVVKDIKSNMGKNTSIAMGNEPNSVALTLPLEKRGKVYLRELVETEEFKQFAKDNPLPMLTGIDENGNVIMVCLSKLPHLLGAGTTGSGKSVWLNCVLLVLLLTKTPEEVGIFIIDPKMVEFNGYRDFPHVHSVETDPIKSVEILVKLSAEMDRRYALLAKAGCKNIKQYNAKSSNTLKYLVCIIDEYSDLKDMLSSTDEDIEIYIRRLGQKARACGIHLIVATQRPDVNVINGTVKAVLPARVAFNCAATQDYGTILGKKPPFTLMGKGDGVCLGFDGVEPLTRFQGALIADTDDETDQVVEAVLNEWRQILKGSVAPIEEFAKIEVKRSPTLIERAKFLICEDKKVTQRTLQKSLGVKTERIKEVCDLLVSEGWLSEPVNSRSGYQVVVSAENIETFGIWFRETFDSQYWS